jgi:hypothetical protein
VRSRKGMMAGIALEYDFDLYSDECIRDPWRHYAALRRLGAVVRLPRHGNLAITRHAELTAALKDPLTFIAVRARSPTKMPIT